MNNTDGHSIAMPLKPPSLRIADRHHLDPESVPAGANMPPKEEIISSGIKPWPKLLQNLRASRETELMAKYLQRTRLLGSVTA